MNSYFNIMQHKFHYELLIKIVQYLFTCQHLNLFTVIFTHIWTYRLIYYSILDNIIQMLKHPIHMSWDHWYLKLSTFQLVSDTVQFFILHSQQRRIQNWTELPQWSFLRKTASSRYLFLQKDPSQMFDWVLNTSLLNIPFYSTPNDNTQLPNYNFSCLMTMIIARLNIRLPNYKLEFYVT